MDLRALRIDLTDGCQWHQATAFVDGVALDCFGIDLSINVDQITTATVTYEDGSTQTFDDVQVVRRPKVTIGGSAEAGRDFAAAIRAYEKATGKRFGA